MAESLDKKHKAIQNWVKVGLHIQMIQAFKMLDQIQETDHNNVKSDEGCKFSYIINKNARVKIWWDLFTNIFYVMAYFITPYNMAFDLPNKNHGEYET
jgi:hypothetical protein